MNRDTQRLLRILAVVAFVVGLILVWSGPELNGVDWRWFFTCIFAGNALFALSFATT